MKKSLVKYPFLTEDVEIYERDNGHKIVLAHKEGELANVSTWVKTGSINENDKINGISHFLEHLMFKGTHKHKAGEFDRILEAKGAIVNAATWKDYTFYYVTLPEGENSQNLYDAMGDCYIQVGSQRVEISQSTLPTLSEGYTITISETGTYYVQVYSMSGYLLYSYKVQKTAPLNAFAIIAIVLGVIAAIVIVIITIRLRKRQKVK